MRGYGCAHAGWREGRGQQELRPKSSILVLNAGELSRILLNRKEQGNGFIR